jgi:hypothetical protein
VIWSLLYAALGVYWAISGRGFPYTPEIVSDGMGPLLGRFGPSMDWIVVMMAGIPAVALGTAMLRGVRGRALRPLFITAGVLLAGILLLMMTSLDLLVLFGYLPYTIRSLVMGDKISQVFVKAWTQWVMIHQLMCLIGGFLWLAATVSYAAGARCLPICVAGIWRGWKAGIKPFRIAVYVALVGLCSTFTRYAWA